MPEIYCPYCFTLNSGRKGACKNCRRWIPGIGTHMALGVILLATVIGVAVTALYGFLMFCGWNRWKLIFGVSDPEVELHEHYADEAAFLLGVVVFVAATVVAANQLYSSGNRYRRTPEPTDPDPPLGPPPPF